ncbi:hypothetical protein L3X38_000340 [Prunus dulcis]|uniref:Uncharacterized protein n=1 Tax=Prunus dulcis TaxID=3755 RepID=A0AAD4YJV5_PRUDU|nr:hypothetical protein L3X38_000340 [Prunus dulcis]
MGLHLCSTWKIFTTLLENVRSNYQVAVARAVHCACNIPPVRDIPSLSFLCAGIHLMSSLHQSNYTWSSYKVRAYLQRQWKQILSEGCLFRILYLQRRASSVLVLAG